MSGFPEKSPSTLNAIFDSIPDLVVVYDENGRYVDVLTGHQVLSFQSPKELIGRNVRDLLGEETAGTILDGIERALSTGEVQTIEYEVELAGQSFWFEGRIAAIESEKQDPDRVVFIARDISQRRRQQEELERQNERLEEFARVVSHDLRSPLNVIDGSLELAEQTGEAEHFDRCRRALERMEQLIDDLLALARQDELVDETVPVELSTVVERCWETVDTESATHAVETTDTILADEARLRQLLENLFRNAAEHGGQDVTITVGSLDGGFYVADDGDGIPEPDHERVFERGFSTANRGTGFGLAIVDRIATAHGWDVSVVDGENGGARFEITGVETA